MENIVDKYLNGLKKAYYEREGQEIWDHFENIKHGISSEDEAQLRQTFPHIPESLIALLQFVDGTHWRAFKNEKIAFYILGSDMEEYPYYISSAEQMMTSKDADYLADYIDRIYDEVKVDDCIISDSKAMNWLHFSNCMNNGGTSQLYIDFSPSAKGKMGQIIRYTHDPDELVVITDSFDAYLEMLIADDFQFIVDYMLE
jgi:hypothetical protein